jgi:hypothetical protein
VGKELLHNLTSPQHASCEWSSELILIQLKQFYTTRSGLAFMDDERFMMCRPTDAARLATKDQPTGSDTACVTLTILVAVEGAGGFELQDGRFEERITGTFKRGREGLMEIGVASQPPRLRGQPAGCRHEPKKASSVDCPRRTANRTISSRKVLYMKWFGAQYTQRRCKILAFTLGDLSLSKTQTRGFNCSPQTSNPDQITQRRL